MDVINKSADVNTAQLVGTQNGEVIVHVYDWVTFLGDHFQKGSPDEVVPSLPY